MKNYFLSFAFALILFFLLLFPEVQAASLFISPTSGSFRLGNTFSVELKIDSADTAINVASARLRFPADILEIQSISKDNSVFSIWAEEPSFSKEKGEISFVGGLPHPGFQETGNIITINFLAKKEGDVELTLGESHILADDGKGTEILSVIKEAKYFIMPPEFLAGIGKRDLLSQIFSLSHPKEDEWYSNQNPLFQWTIAPEIAGVSFVFDQNPTTLPDTNSEGLLNSKNYFNVADGIWYFHLRLAKPDGWTDSSHYKIQIDTKPPRPFDIIIDNAGDNTNPQPTLYFETIDETSGIDHYKLKIGEADFLDLALAQINPFIPPGNWPIVVRAVDQAGNNIRTSVQVQVDPILSPEILIWPKNFISGEEIFYLEGTSLPQVKVTIFLEKDNKIFEEWQVLSSKDGEWSFSTRDFLKSGNYNIFARAQDERGAVSEFSEKRQTKVIFNGISLGPLMFTFKMLALFLTFFLFLGIVFAFYIGYKIYQTKELLAKEIKEAKDILPQAFADLEREAGKKIAIVDAKPGLSKAERKVYEDLKESIQAAKERIEKEVSDIERELG